MYAVILAGGGGTRLWPLSRPERPKPFLPLLGDETLFQRTVRRLREGPELGLTSSDIVVVADPRYAALVREQEPAVGIIEEPIGRNTAPAIALAALAFERGDDEVMIVLPADHTIRDEGAFRSVLRAASGIAGGAFDIESPLVTLGVQITRPSVEYGYLLPVEAYVGPDRPDTLVSGLHVYPLRAFKEKPGPEEAERLSRESGVAWNAGMFLWRRRAIREAFERFKPEIVEGIEGGLSQDRLPAVYADLPAISVDYAVLEPAAQDGAVVMGSMDVGWNDIGSWQSLIGALPGGGPIDSARIVPEGTIVDLGENDLLVLAEGARLAVMAGPARIEVRRGHAAVLLGAVSRRAAVTQCVARVNEVGGGS